MIKLSSDDHQKLNATLDTILKALVSGEVSLEVTRGALAHIITAAVLGNESVVRGWLQPEAVVDWNEME